MPTIEAGPDDCGEPFDDHTNLEPGSVDRQVVQARICPNDAGQAFDEPGTAPVGFLDQSLGCLRLERVQSVVPRGIRHASGACTKTRMTPEVRCRVPGVIRVFVHAPEAWRILAAQQTYALEPEAAKTLIRESDRRRARFIESLTGVVWTDARLYDLTVDTSRLEIGMVVEWLAAVVRARFNRRHATLRTES